MSLFFDRNISKFLKRYSLGLSLLETIIVLSLTAALFDVINFAIFKAQQLALEKDKAVYLVTIKDDVAAFLQRQREMPFCDIVTSNRAASTCPSVKEVKLKNIMDPLHYSNLSEKYKKVTHVLIKVEALDSNPEVGYLSALIFTEEDPKQTKLDTARINTLVGPSAGQLSITDPDLITNGRSTFAIKKSSWDPALTKLLGEASNVLYLPSSLNEMVKNSTTPAAVDITDFTFTEANIPRHCTQQCHWYPVYTTDSVQVKFNKKSSSTDHVRIELISKSKPDIGAVYYSSTFFNNQTVKILADTSWYNHTLALQITPYDIDNNPGPVTIQSVYVTQPDAQHFRIPFNVVLKYSTYNVNNSNKPQSKLGNAKLYITSFLETNRKNATDNNVYTFLEPVTIVASYATFYDSNATRKGYDPDILVKQNLSDTSAQVLLPEETDFDKLMADPNRYAFKHALYWFGAFYLQSKLQLYWDKNILKEQKGPIHYFDTIPSLERLALTL